MNQYQQPKVFTGKYLGKDVSANWHSNNSPDDQLCISVGSIAIFPNPNPPSSGTVVHKMKLYDYHFRISTIKNGQDYDAVLTHYEDINGVLVTVSINLPQVTLKFQNGITTIEVDVSPASHLLGGITKLVVSG